MNCLLRTLIAVIWLVAIAALPAKAAERPNIVLILLDDVGYSDYGCSGSEIETPNIDRLAREGIQFTQFYNNAICQPTRASLLTGLYPRYVGANKQIQLTPQMMTIGEVLQSAGYQTSLSGKWHLGGSAPHRPIDRGFAAFFGMLDGCSNHFDPSIPDPPFEGGRTRVWARNAERLTKFPQDFYSSDVIADHAIENIRRFAASGKPFFAHVCFTAAHSPLHAKPTDIAKYRGKYAAGWDEIRRRRRERQLELGIINRAWNVPPREPEVAAWDAESLQAWNEHLMEVYAAMVDSIDQNIGRILQTLKETGAVENTVVLVLNDNGGCAEQAGGDDPTNIAGPKECYVSCGAGWAYAQNTPFRRYKGWVHEGGIATPLVAFWPGVIQAGRLTRQVGHVVDLLPTCADIAGARYPAEHSGNRLLPLEGQSLVPILRGKGAPLDERTLYWKAFDNRAVREERWKLVRDQNVGQWELYDIEADRTETRDLAQQHPERVQQLEVAWNDWAQRTGASQQPLSTYTLKRVPAHLPLIKIALIGDSTVASYSKPPADRPTLTGWGQVFDLYFNDAVQIRNHAVSGRSSKSFLREGRWEPVLAEKPDYVFIQFGHNDQPGKGDRTTDPNGDFQDNLRKYIDEARAAGAVPVLVTPVARRTFGNGHAQTTLTPYADAMKSVAREKKVPLVDLHARSFELYDELGDEASADFSPSTSDRTHFSRKGAKQIARLVAYALPTTIPALRHYLRQPWQVPQD
jgi:arylsulfatase A-like enzyme/lysophospholipase L1-like esterase